MSVGARFGGTCDAPWIAMLYQVLSPLRLAASVSLALALLGSQARAQAQNPPLSTIRVTGEGSVTARPDRVEVDLGVVTRGSTAQQAATENARVLSNVLAALRRALGPKPTIETISYALYPDYQYPQNGGDPKITGYTATNLVRVTQDDLRNVGAVLDTATRAGANRVERIRFSLKDENPVKAQALRIAALEARAKAATLASALGLQIARIHSVEEVGPAARPLFELALARGSAPTTPILPGSIETSATVTLTVELVRR